MNFRQLLGTISEILKIKLWKCEKVWRDLAEILNAERCKSIQKIWKEGSRRGSRNRKKGDTLQFFFILAEQSASCTTAQHSKFQPKFVKLFRMFTILFSKSHWFFPNSSLQFANFDENLHIKIFQQILRKRPESVRIWFSNFLRFRNGNCRIFRKWFSKNLKKIRKKLELEQNPF